MFEHPLDRGPIRAAPEQFAFARPLAHAHPELDLLLGQVADQPTKRAQFVKFAEDEPDDLLDLFIRVELHLAGGAPDVADRQRKLQFAPLGAALATLVHALLQDMEFSFRQSSLQP